MTNKSPLIYEQYSFLHEALVFLLTTKTLDFHAHNKVICQ